jgi:uncharacterized protein (UPF0262 family)
MLNKVVHIDSNLQNYIHKIELDENLFIRRNALIEAARAAAIRDIVSKHLFSIVGHNNGPYYVRLGIENHRLILKTYDCMRIELPHITLSLTPFRKLIKDYFLICESYQMAYACGDAMRLEAIDMARRGVHDEGARCLTELLTPFAVISHDAARGIFTLVCVLHIGNTQPW